MRFSSGPERRQEFLRLRRVPASEMGRERTGAEEDRGERTKRRLEGNSRREEILKGKYNR